MTTDCKHCGAHLDGDGPCIACGLSEDGPDPEAIFAQGEKGRILGEAAAKLIAPGRPMVSHLLGTMGRLIGRRMAKGHPLISFGESAPALPKKKKRARKAPPKTKAIAKRKRSRKKP